MTFLVVALAAVLVFGAVIFIHELGHFAVAKWSGIKVNEFALGMGPTLVKFTKGETTYALRLLPIGGFVSMEGEDEESDDSRSFQKAPIPRRMLVMVAGAFMNLLLGFLALVVVLSASPSPYIASRQVALVENEALGLQVGDVIQRVNGRRAFIFQDLDYEFLRTQNGTLDLEVKRDGQRVQLKGVTFGTQIATDEKGEPIMNETTGKPYEFLSLGFKVYPIEKNVFTIMREAFMTTLSYARIIYLSLFDLITGRVPINQLSGPVGIVNEIGKAASIGWLPVVQLLALISVNLGVMNMLPLPALDGGRALLLVVEAVRRKPLPQKYEMAINIAGFALLMLLMVFVSFNDIVRLVT